MPKEYTLIGGNGTRVSPLEVTESGTYEAGDSRAFNPVKVNVPSGSSTLSGLTDVDISNPTDGQTLVYNATSGKWENGAGGGGGALIVHWSHDEVHGIYTLDKTWKEIADAILVGPVLLLLDDIGSGEYSLSSVPIEAVGIKDGIYQVDSSQGYFETDSETGYPYYQAD